MSEFHVGELALVLPPIDCDCACCRKGTGQIVTVVEPLQSAEIIFGGLAYRIRHLDGDLMWLRPERLQKLPPARDEIRYEETSHV